MNKQEIKELLVQIKIFYPRFSAVEVDQNTNQFVIKQSVTDSWFERLGWMEKPRAIAILDDYMESGEIKAPGISLWMRSGKTVRNNVWHSAWLDLLHGVIVWEPEKGRKEERRIVRENHGTYEDEFGYLWAFAES